MHEQTEKTYDNMHHENTSRAQQFSAGNCPGKPCSCRALQWPAEARERGTRACQRWEGATAGVYGVGVRRTYLDLIMGMLTQLAAATAANGTSFPTSGGAVWGRNTATVTGSTQQPLRGRNTDTVTGSRSGDRTRPPSPAARSSRSDSDEIDIVNQRRAPPLPNHSAHRNPHHPGQCFPRIRASLLAARQPTLTRLLRPRAVVSAPPVAST